MTVNPIKTWSTGETLLLGDLNNEFANIYAALNSVGGSTIVDGSITSAKLADGANPGVYFGEIFNDEIVTTGLSFASDSGLTLTLLAGTAYIIDASSSPTRLVRVQKTTSSVHTLAAASTNYIHLKANGQFVVNTSVTLADAVTLWQAVTDGSGVTANADFRDTEFLEAAKVARRYVDNVVYEVTSATEIIVRSGTHFRDITNNRSYTFAADVTVDITSGTGALGLDQGTEASTTWYALVAMGDSTGAVAPSALLVTAANYSGSFIIDAAYDHHKRIGWVRNDGSSDLIQGEYIDGRFHYDEGQQVLTSGASVAFATVTCSTVVPPNIRSGLLYGNIQTGGGSGNSQWRTTGSGASTGKQWASSGSETSGYGGVFLLNASQQIDYRNSIGSFDIWVDGWVDTLEKDE